MKICYTPREFRGGSMEIINKADALARQYAAQGYDLTLRQLYYQFVARGWLPNKQTEYDRLGSIINDARLAGLLDWNHIVDRTRNMMQNSHWEDPSEVIASALSSYANDKWSDQDVRPEVWVEKEALVGVIERVARQNDVPYFACRGYVSQSELWAAARRLERYIDAGQRPIILHFGDHDPSGMDMTRDIRDRLTIFLDGDNYDSSELDVRRLALNMSQVRQYNPPPNPAKLSDSRVGGYMARYGDESWELDALEPAVITALVQDELETLRDDERWEAAVQAEETDRLLLRKTSERWPDVAAFLA